MRVGRILGIGPVVARYSGGSLTEGREVCSNLN